MKISKLKIKKFNIQTREYFTLNISSVKPSFVGKDDMIHVVVNNNNIFTKTYDNKR
jgi:hypothetical protein